MLTPEIKKRLSEETLDEKLQKLEAHIKSSLRGSRSKISKNYQRWDRNIAVYRGLHIRDEEDLQAADANEPEKSVIPMSFAQVQTWAAFGFMLFRQNTTFYEMKATGAEDHPLADLIERGLERDLCHNAWNSKLYQFLLDMARCSIAPIKHWWTVDTAKIQVSRPMSLDILGLPQFGGEETLELTTYEGNRIQNVSPFRFLPDLRLPITRWREGRFVADEDEWHITNVKELEKKNLAAGVKYVRQADRNLFKESDRVESRFATLAAELNSGSRAGQDATDFMTVKVEGNIWLTPQEYDLGPEDHPVLFNFILANDRLISIMRQNALHFEFNYDLGVFSPDSEARLAEGLCDTINALQETVSWLYNTRIQSVRRSLDNHLVVHPSYVDLAALESRSPIIPLSKNTPVDDIRKYVSQIQVADSTTGHFQDADTLMKTMMFVTGVNENAMGQYAPGRRSATENRAANIGASSRMKMLLSCAWEMALGPLGRKLSINQRQGITLPTYQKIFGSSEEVLAKWPAFAPEDPAALVGNDDFLVFDGTLQSEKGFLAQNLQELVTTVIQNPEFAMASGFDLQSALDEIQTLRGTSNVRRFFKPPQVQPVPGATGMAPGGTATPAGPTVPPGFTPPAGAV
jgi:hypothetical protein